ncbi:DUF4252 domain-containing protein [candidate division KSB1 bacterium]|nr:DUF4252 domain-containing protein [candidate division KSB1 bacterium]MBL7094086.1 DUF4252 domain-containing protein [candidate division KSB1 bacterium]
MKRYIIVLLFVLVLPFSASAQENYSKYQGYVDLSDIEEFKDSDETVEIFITKPLLSLVAAATSSGEDPSFSNLLKNLALIRVETFNVKEKETTKVKKIIQKVSKKLTKEKWSRIVRVKEKDERVEIFIKPDGEKIAGLLIMSLKPDKEAVFVNIVGNIDMEQLGKLSRKFDIPQLDSLEVKKKSKK